MGRAAPRDKEEFFVVFDLNSDVLIIMHVLKEFKTDARKEVDGLARFEGRRGAIVAKKVESLSYVKVMERD